MAFSFSGVAVHPMTGDAGQGASTVGEGAEELRLH